MTTVAVRECHVTGT